MKKIVFAVNSGCYSDYSVDAIFSTKERAEDYMRQFPKSGYDGYNNLGEYELDPMDRFLKSGRWPWVVTMDRGGNVMDARQLEELSEEAHAIYRGYQPAVGPEIPERMWATVYARDAKHAVKIANELRGMLIANDEWRPT